MNRNESKKLQVGPQDMVSFVLGVGMPLLILSSALVLAVSVRMNRNAGSAFSLGLTIGLVLAIAIEMLRRYVLVTRPVGGRGAVKLFRGVIWLVVLGALPVTTVVAIGVMTKCYGQICTDLPRLLLIAMLGWLLLCLPGVPFGYRLLSRATWLQRR